jgi:hypothetical protein
MEEAEHVPQNMAKRIDASLQNNESHFQKILCAVICNLYSVRYKLRFLLPYDFKGITMVFLCIFKIRKSGLFMSLIIMLHVSYISLSDQELAVMYSYCSI